VRGDIMLFLFVSLPLIGVAQVTTPTVASQKGHALLWPTLEQPYPILNFIVTDDLQFAVVQTQKNCTLYHLGHEKVEPVWDSDKAKIAPISVKSMNYDVYIAGYDLSKIEQQEGRFEVEDLEQIGILAVYHLATGKFEILLRQRPFDFLAIDEGTKLLLLDRGLMQTLQARGSTNNVRLPLEVYDLSKKVVVRKYEIDIGRDPALTLQGPILFGYHQGLVTLVVSHEAKKEAPIPILCSQDLEHGQRSYFTDIDNARLLYPYNSLIVDNKGESVAFCTQSRSGKQAFHIVRLRDGSIMGEGKVQTGENEGLISFTPITGVLLLASLEKDDIVSVTMYDASTHQRKGIATIPVVGKHQSIMHIFGCSEKALSFLLQVPTLDEKGQVTAQRYIPGCIVLPTPVPDAHGK
jgi:hypothetical protein